MTERGSILIVGVGGQGVILASDVLASVCLAQGLDVKKSDVHGMAQRGGIVYSFVRYGPVVHSPMIEEGQADAVVAMEWAEALRWLPYLRPEGTVIVDGAEIVPPVACADRRTWASRYPVRDLRKLAGERRQVFLVDARALAKSSGVAKAANVVLLGTLSRHLPFPLAAWEAAIQRLVPRGSAEANLKAFAAGGEVQPQASISEPAMVVRPASPPRRFAVEVIDAWCKGCDICVRLCPEDCLRLDHRGIVRVVAPEACTGCRLCEFLCPDFAIAVQPEEVFRGGQGAVIHG